MRGASKKIWQAKIAFSDIRKVVSWGPEQAADDREDGHEPKTRATVTKVTVLESSSIDPDTAAAVAEVYQSATGDVRVKMHDKPAALEKLACSRTEPTSRTTASLSRQSLSLARTPNLNLHPQRLVA
jgi:hypothetical protein